MWIIGIGQWVIIKLGKKKYPNHKVFDYWNVLFVVNKDFLFNRKKIMYLLILQKYELWIMLAVIYNYKSANIVQTNYNAFK